MHRTSPPTVPRPRCPDARQTPLTVRCARTRAVWRNRALGESFLDVSLPVSRTKSYSTCWLGLGAGCLQHCLHCKHAFDRLAGTCLPLRMGDELSCDVNCKRSIFPRLLPRERGFAARIDEVHRTDLTSNVGTCPTCMGNFGTCRKNQVAAVEGVERVEKAGPTA
jgi:hypothetical protein